MSFIKLILWYVKRKYQSIKKEYNEETLMQNLRKAPFTWPIKVSEVPKYPTTRAEAFAIWEKERTGGVEKNKTQRKKRK